jgi:hypothetical protein
MKDPGEPFLVKTSNTPNSSGCWDPFGYGVYYATTDSTSVSIFALPVHNL